MTPHKRLKPNDNRCSVSNGVNVGCFFTLWLQKVIFPLYLLTYWNNRQQTVIVMKHWTQHKFFILLLGVFVTLSMGLSNVAANTMTLKMPMSSSMRSDMGIKSQKDCGDCGSTDSKAMVCAAGCIASVPVVLAQVTISTTKTILLSFAPLVVRLTSRNYPPDPYPPRPIDLA